MLFIFAGLGCLVIYSQTKTISEKENEIIVIDEVKDGEIFAFGKTVIVKKGAKGVLVFGGDIIVEGRVEEDVAVIGGSIIQKNDSFIGGDVIIFGGKYEVENKESIRNSNKETIIFFAGYEDELREMTQNPSQLFSPQFNLSYLFWRILSVLFWFIATILFTTIAPQQVSRAITRFQLASLKIVGLGLLTFILVTIFVIIGLGYLPSFLGGIISILGILTILFAYFFGRVSLNVSLGKFLQKRIISEKFHSESLAILIGTMGWVAILSIPYIGNLALVLLFATSLGLLITTRSNNNWKGV